MKLSTRCRYGLRALIDLSIHSGGGHVALHEIAARQNISLKYLEQDFSVLRRAGFVRSVKGAQGGYLLARPASSIRIGEIIEALEGDLLVIESEETEETDIRSFLGKGLWATLNRNAADALNSLCLSDLVDFQLAHGNREMFYI